MERKSNFASKYEASNGVYVWEEGVIRTWEIVTKEQDKITEDMQTISNLIKKVQKTKLDTKTQNHLGVVRKLFILIDFSEAMTADDFEPSRLEVTLKSLEAFVPLFLRENPLSQLALIQLIKSSAQILSPMSGNCELHLKALQGNLIQKTETSEISIFNGIQLALDNLLTSPHNFSREILIIMAAVSSCDPGDLNKTIEVMTNENVRASVISLTVEVNVCKKMTKLTKGTFSVVFNTQHLLSELMDHVKPLVATSQEENTLMKVGFPHNPIKDELVKRSSNSLNDYECPQCLNACQGLPSVCSICGLMLITVPQLVHSYQHLFTVKPFTEVPFNAQVGHCFACQKVFSMNCKFNIYLCELCKKYFCSHCNTFIHETLQSCVGCSCTRSSQ